MRLHPITEITADVGWPAATWIGEIDEGDITAANIELVSGERFRWARLLVWRNDQARGFVEVTVNDGGVDADDLRAAIGQLPDAPAKAVPARLPPVSVVVCTMDRPDQLRRVLAGLIEIDYPEFEILVVDNNPTSGLTRPVVEHFDERPVRLIEAARRGLSIARNAGIQQARYDIIAFTDDDVIIDRRWLKNLAHEFARSEDVGCVCGLVPSAELLTPAQSYFDRRVGWARSCDVASYHIGATPKDDPLFPFGVAKFGTGANFAVRRDVVLDVGGFDEGLGIGAPAAGGEDIDMFVRILLRGQVLLRQPSAVVWHRHRQNSDDLDSQIYNYGLGLGAWISKLVFHPKTLGMVLRRIRPAIRHLREVTVVDPGENSAPDPILEELSRRELKGVAYGPIMLLRARMSGRAAAPLKASLRKSAWRFISRSDAAENEPGGSVRAARLSFASVALGLVGAVGAIHFLPSAVLAVTVGAFVLLGPGSLVLSWFTDLPAYAMAALLPAVSLAVCLVVVSGLLMFGFYNPVAVLLGLTSATAAGGLLRWSYLARRHGVTQETHCGRG